MSQYGEDCNLNMDFITWTITVVGCTKLLIISFLVMLSACTASFYWEQRENPAKDSEGKDQVASIFV